MKRSPSMGQIARAATARAAQRGWHSMRKVHPSAAQRAVTALFLAFLFVVAARGGVKAARRWRKCRPDPGADALGYRDPIFPAPTAFRRAGELARPVDACAQAADFPQVSLLLLTKGEAAHDGMWRQWFAAAGGQVPAAAAAAAACAPGAPAGAAAALAAACVAGGDQDDPSGDVIGRQHLFDVWVHTLVNFTGFPPSSVFHGRELPPEFRVTAVWGTHTLIDAERALLAAGLTNPRAAKFVLLSESDVPLYSPQAVYAQLLEEPASRVNACNNDTAGRGWNHNDGYRLRDDMVAEGLTPATWRKSWQWVALNRAHAELAVRDEAVDAAFRATCRRRWDPEWCDHRVCYSDEHYFPTLLATHGLENETDCFGELTDRDWGRVAATDPHPWEYRPREVGPALFRALRHAERPGCRHAEGVGAAAAAQFMAAAALGASRAAMCDDLEAGAAAAAGFRRLGPYCPLLARKFLGPTAPAVLAALLPCEGGLGVLNDPAACNTTAVSRQQQLLAGLDLDFPPEERPEAHLSRAALGAGGAAALAVALGVWALRRRRQRKQLPMHHSESFHTTLRHYGVLD